VIPLGCVLERCLFTHPRLQRRKVAEGGTGETREKRSLAPSVVSWARYDEGDDDEGDDDDDVPQQQPGGDPQNGIGLHAYVMGASHRGE